MGYPAASVSDAFIDYVAANRPQRFRWWRPPFKPRPVRPVVQSAPNRLDEEFDRQGTLCLINNTACRYRWGQRLL